MKPKDAKVDRVGPKSLLTDSHQISHSDDDHDEHVDERWLVSYADMMTLLFGLFVLLFSMSKLDPKIADEMQRNAREKFKPEAPKTAPQADRTPEFEAKIVQLEKDLEQRLTENQKKENELAVLKNELAAQRDLANAKDQGLAKASKTEAALLSLKQKLRAQELLEQKSEEQKSQIAELNEKLKKTEHSEATKIRELASLPKPEETDQLKTQIDQLEQQIKTEKTANAELKTELEKAIGGRGQNFMAFFINWATKDHDVDLVITDPKGHTYDFKRRSYPNSAGLFALDTRRGPGVELWQSKDILPGRYIATYSLYNDYGNSAPAPVNAVILTPKGSFEIPTVELDTKNHRKVSVEFNVETSGAVTITKAPDSN